MSDRNEDLKRYHHLAARIHDLEDERTVLRQKLLERGNHATTDYLCAIKPGCRETVSVVDIKKKSPKLYIQLDDMDLIRTRDYSTVSVQPKAKKAA